MRHRQLAVIALSAAIVAASLAGCAGEPGAAQNAAPPPASPSPTSLPTVSTTPTAPPASVQIVIHVAPDRTSVQAGDGIAATVRIENRTGRPLEFNEGLCNGKVPIGIENAKVPFDPPIAAIGCSTWLLPAAGFEYRGTISTSYGACGTSGIATPGVPHCLPSGGMPPLPVGTYRTAVALVTDDGRVAFDGPVAITLTR
jgi:hypothetical protein